MTDHQIPTLLEGPACQDRAFIKGNTSCSFLREHALWDSGITRVAGVDEAGRGPLAGPVVASAVIFQKPVVIPGLNDSKKLTSSKRDRLYQLLSTHPEVEWSVAVVEPDEIDRVNILRATHLAMARALAEMKMDHALVDGLPVNGLPVPHTAIVKGDGISFSIAAASIIAKVTRDRIMRELHARYPEYGFLQHKGYPTASHLAMLRIHGPSPIHRRSFAPVAKACADL
jgi:ribonuclease HII